MGCTAFINREYTPWGDSWFEYSTMDVYHQMNIPFRFTGKELERTQLYYYGARYYSPAASVWMSPDPILGKYLDAVGKGNGGIFNSKNIDLYSYAHNNPIIMVDPDGESAGFANQVFEYVGGLFQGGYKKTNDIIGNPIRSGDANYLGSISKTAFSLGWIVGAKRAGTNEGDTYKRYANAIRHMAFTALTTRKYGEEFARKYAERHEFGEKNTLDNRVDEYNNEIGIKIGLMGLSEAETMKEVVKAFYANESINDCMIDNRAGLDTARRNGEPEFILGDHSKGEAPRTRPEINVPKPSRNPGVGE